MGLIDKLLCRAVYFDTNIFIYLLEGSVEYAKQIRSIKLAIEAGEFKVFSSEIIFSEILPLHVKANDHDKIQIIIEFLSASGAFNLVPADRDVCIQSGFLRGMAGMKTPDALHVATAIQSGCDIFLTNDKRIKTPDSLELVILSDHNE